MDENYRQQRHTRLWEEQNKHIKRTALTGLVFAAFILFNVLQPFSEQQKESSSVQQEIIILQQEKDEAEASLKRVMRSEQELTAIHEEIQRER
jgi:hypothetical protein